MAGSFFDTNVLIQLASEDLVKADRVERLIRQGGTISVQVLNEVANVARRKMRLSWPDTNLFLANLRNLFVILPLTIEIHDLAISLAQRFGFSVYDAMIVAAARSASCETLWSEDMHHGLVVETRLRIVNPFA